MTEVMMPLKPDQGFELLEPVETLDLDGVDVLVDIDRVVMDTNKYFAGILQGLQADGLIGPEDATEAQGFIDNPRSAVDPEATDQTEIAFFASKGVSSDQIVSIAAQIPSEDYLHEGFLDFVNSLQEAGLGWAFLTKGESVLQSIKFNDLKRALENSDLAVPTVFLVNAAKNKIINESLPADNEPKKIYLIDDRPDHLVGLDQRVVAVRMRHPGEKYSGEEMPTDAHYLNCTGFDSAKSIFKMLS